VQVQADDGNGGTDSQLISVTVTDVNDAPVITSNSSTSVAENQTSVLSVTTSDQDLPADTMIYSIIGGADEAKFTINVSTGELAFITFPDFENPGDVDLDNVYEVQVQAEDGNGGTDSQLISVTVTEVNEAPTDISLDNSSLPENSDGGIVGNLSVVDPDTGDTHTWSVNDSRFEIIGSQLKLKAGETLNHEAESTVNLSITATDQVGAGLAYNESFDVTVGDVNEAPTDIALSDSHVVEKTTGAVVGTLGVADPDVGDTHVWQVDDARFEIVGTQLKLKAGQDLEASSEPTVELVITATDLSGAGIVFNKPFTIAVETPIVAPPPDLTPDPEPEAEQESEIEEDEEELEEENEPEDGSVLDPEVAAVSEAVEETTSESEQAAAEPEQPTVKPILVAALNANTGVSQFAISNFGRIDVSDLQQAENETGDVDQEGSLLDSLLQNSLATTLSRIDFAMMSQSGDMWDSLDEQRRVVDSVVQSDLIVIGSAGVAASSATVGVVAWGMRSGFLFSGVLAQMPAWQAVDPMIVMQGLNGGGGFAKETVEQLMERRRLELTRTGH
jgi:hypothetical protein